MDVKSVDSNRRIEYLPLPFVRLILNHCAAIIRLTMGVNSPVSQSN